MNEISEFKKFISVILIFVILIQMQGCVSTKIINSVADIPVSEKYTYILHTPTTRYQLLNAGFSDGIISGNLVNGKHAQTVDKVHLYLQADSLLKFNSDMTLVLSVDKVSKIKLEKPSIAVTAILFGGILLTIILIISVFPIKGSYRGM
jgi:hypothetical protein